MGENKMSILNNFFTRNTFHHCFQDGKARFYEAVIRQYINDYEGKPNADLISKIYSIMHMNYRNEYYYKNTLFNKLVLGVHSLKTTTALTELPVGDSKADFIMINGKAVVYEIKTELDNFCRLTKQLEDYYRAFDHVAVITCKEKVSELENIVKEMELPIGIYILQKNDAIKTICKPRRFTDRIDLKIIFSILRKTEYENILKNQYGELPIVSDFEYYSVCEDMFKKIPLQRAYDLFLQQLKKRVRHLDIKIKEIPYELKSLAYFMQMGKKEYFMATEFLNSCYQGG